MKKKDVSNIQHGSEGGTALRGHLLGEAVQKIFGTKHIPRRGKFNLGGEELLMNRANNEFIKQQQIKNLILITSYRGGRHKLGFPVRGQRTHTNAKTRRKRKIS